jgi:subtilisin family serine protease
VRPLGSRLAVSAVAFVVVVATVVAAAPGLGAAGVVRDVHSPLDTPEEASGDGTNGNGTAAETNGSTTVAEAPGRPSKSSQLLRDERVTRAAAPAQAQVSASTSSSVGGEGRTRVVVELETTHPSAYRDRLRAHGAHVEVEHGTLVQVTLPTANVTTVAALRWVQRVRRPTHPAPTAVSEGVSVVDADAVQAAGVSGDGVRVGVVDLGFDPSAPEIRDNVVASRSFRATQPAPDHRTHGTAVSELVVDTAPNASLYLATVDTDVEFAAAVSWLRGNDVDVVTASVNWVNQPYDGTGFVSQVADEAVADGVVWTNSAGNYARRHWEGRYRNADDDQWAEFGPGDERNYLNDGRPLSGRVGVSLSWNDWPQSDDDYDLFLYRDVPPYGARSQGEDVLVARSTRAQTGFQRPTESVGPTVDRGVYYVTVSNYDADGSHVLELYTRDAAGSLEHETPESSLAAPATARDVVAVGAFDWVDGRVEPFSSRGPTNDGRRGVDVVGPDRVSTSRYASFAGTSAAAPHVAGVSALVRERKPGATPDQVKRRLQRGATDVGPVGPDPTSGYGRLNATRAVFGEGDLGVVGVGETRRGVVDAQDPFSPAFRGYYEPVALSGVEGVRVSVEMRAKGWGRDPYLFLLAPNGSVVATDDDGGAGLNASLVHTFAHTGRYTVVAGGFGTTDTFPYELSVVERPELTPVSLRLAPNVTSVEAGERVAFTVVRADTGAPVNATVQYDDVRTVTGADGRALVRFDRPGTYRVTATAPPTATERFRTDEGRVTVAAAAPDPARFEVVGLSVPETVRRGERVWVTATVANTGERTGSQTVHAGIDRNGDGALEPVVDESVGLAPGETYSGSRPVLIPRYLPPGTYLVGVRTANETVTRTVRVEG